MRPRDINYRKLLIIFDKYKCKRGRFKINKKSTFYIKLFEHFNFCKSLKEIYYVLNNNIYSKEKCLYCDELRTSILTNTCKSRTCRNKYVATKIDYKKRTQKTINTLITNYGVTNVSQIPEVKEKIEKIMLKKYGSKYFFGSNAHKKMLLEDNPTWIINNIKNRNLLTQDYISNNFIKDNKLLVEECLDFYNISISTLNKQKIKLDINVDNFYTDKNHIEDKINNIFNNIFVVRNRTLIKPLEVDLVNFDKKLAIEYNGLLWHSYGSTYPYNININKYNHLTKTNMVENKDFTLYHIFENEFLDKIKRNIWLNKINKKLNNINIDLIDIHNLENISKEELDSFLKINSLEDDFIGRYNIGVKHNNELIAVATFNIQNEEATILQICEKSDVSIMCVEKQITDFIKNKYNIKTIIIYNNRRFSNNNYKLYGYNLINKTEPNMYYFIVGENRLYKNICYSIDYLINNGYRIIYDCGYEIYKKDYNEN